MSEDKRILHKAEGSPTDPRFSGGCYLFWCPGCECAHWFKTEGDGPRWTFNGDMERPDVSPSIRVQAANVCHLFIRNGTLEYCGDSWHQYAGKTIPMEPF